MSRWIALALLLSFWPRPSAATVAVFTDMNGWNEAKTIALHDTEQVIFGRLTRPGQSHFVTWTVTTPQPLELTLSVSTSASDDFHPRLAFYQPDSQTIGPVLPMEQPPSTLASVYPATTSVAVFEGLTQIEYVNRLSLTLTPEMPGRYFLAVYNADQVPGRYRLTIQPAETNSWTALTEYPDRWWTSQVWAGLSVRTIFFPAAVLSLLFLIGWMIMVRMKAPVKVRRR